MRQQVRRLSLVTVTRQLERHVVSTKVVRRLLRIGRLVLQQVLDARCVEAGADDAGEQVSLEEKFDEFRVDVELEAASERKSLMVVSLFMFMYINMNKHAQYLTQRLDQVDGNLMKTSEVEQERHFERRKQQVVAVQQFHDVADTLKSNRK